MRLLSTYVVLHSFLLVVESNHSNTFPKIKTIHQTKSHPKTVPTNQSPLDYFTPSRASSNIPPQNDCSFVPSSLIQKPNTSDLNLCVKIQWYFLDKEHHGNAYFTYSSGLGFVGITKSSEDAFSLNLKLVDSQYNGFKLVSVDLPNLVLSFEQYLSVDLLNHPVSIATLTKTEDSRETLHCDVSFNSGWKYRLGPFLENNQFDFGSFTLGACQIESTAFLGNVPFDSDVAHVLKSKLFTIFFSVLGLVPLMYLSLYSDRLTRKEIVLVLNPWVLSVFCFLNLVVLHSKIRSNFRSPHFVTKTNLKMYLDLMIVIFNIFAVAFYVFYIFKYYFAFRTSRGFSLFDLQVARFRPFFQVILVACFCASTGVFYHYCGGSGQLVLGVLWYIPLCQVASSFGYARREDFLTLWYHVPVYLQYLALVWISSYPVSEVFVVDQPRPRDSFRVLGLLLLGLWVSVNALQRLRRPFFFLPKRWSPRFFDYVVPLKRNVLVASDCSFCLNPLDTPVNDDPLYRGVRGHRLKYCMKKPCGAFAHKFCLKLYLKVEPTKKCFCCDQVLPEVVEDSDLVALGFLVMYVVWIVGLGWSCILKLTRQE